MPPMPMRTAITALVVAAGLFAASPAGALDLWAETGYAPPRISLEAARAAVERDRLRHLSTRLQSRELSLETRRRVLTRLPQNGPVAAQVRALDRRLDRLENERRRIERARSPAAPRVTGGASAAGGVARGSQRLGVSAGGVAIVPAGSGDASETARLFVERLLRQNEERQSAR